MATATGRISSKLIVRAATPAFMARAFRFGFWTTVAVWVCPMPKSCRPTLL